MGKGRWNVLQEDLFTQGLGEKKRLDEDSCSFSKEPRRRGALYYSVVTWDEH